MHVKKKISGLKFLEYIHACLCAWRLIRDCHKVAHLRTLFYTHVDADRSESFATVVRVIQSSASHTETSMGRIISKTRPALVTRPWRPPCKSRRDAFPWSLVRTANDHVESEHHSTVRLTFAFLLFSFRLLSEAMSSFASGLLGHTSSK